MTTKRLVHTGTFTATDDQGRHYTINEFTTMIQVATRGGVTEVAGLKELHTADGHSVNKVGQGEYDILILASKRRVRSTDPNAT